MTGFVDDLADDGAAALQRVARFLAWLPRNKAAILGFAVTAAFWPGMLSAAFAPRWAVIAVGVGLVSTLDPREVPEPLRWTLAFLVALGAVSLLGSPDPRAGAMDLIFIVILCGAFLMGAGLDKFDNLMTGIGIGLLPSAAMLLLGLNEDQGRNLSGDTAGMFHNTEVFAEFSALVLVWAIARLALIAAAAAAIPVLLLNSRIAMLAVGVGLLAAYWPRTWPRRLAVVTAMIVFSIIMLFAFGQAKMHSADQRIVLWAATILSMTPLGNGLGWFQSVHPIEEFSHSDALQMIAEIGPLGVVSLLIPIYAFATNRGTNAERGLLTAGCVEIALSFPLHTPASGFLIAAVAGYMAGGLSPVRMDLPLGRAENVGAVRRPGADGAGGFGLGGRSGGDVSDRPVPAGQAALRARHDRDDTTGPRQAVRAV